MYPVFNCQGQQLQGSRSNAIVGRGVSWSASQVALKQTVKTGDRIQGGKPEQKSVMPIGIYLILFRSVQP